MLSYYVGKEVLYRYLGYHNRLSVEQAPRRVQNSPEWQNVLVNLRECTDDSMTASDVLGKIIYRY